MCADERDRIEAAARALSGYGEADWADLADFEQEPYRQQARVGNAAFQRSHREKEMLRAALERQPRSHVVVSPAVGERIERYERDRLAAADAVPAGAGQAEPQKWTGAEVLRTGRPVGEAVNPPWNESVSVATGPTVVVQDTQTGSVSRPVQFAGHIDPDGREAWKQAAEAEAEAGDEARAEVARLRGVAEELAAALAWYAESVNYAPQNPPGTGSPIWRDAGARAREALARFRAGGGES